MRSTSSSRKRSESIPTATSQLGSQPALPHRSTYVRPRESSGPVSIAHAAAAGLEDRGVDHVGDGHSVMHGAPSQP